ncbi:MAG: hypothetical protein KDC23_00660 [Actinobacteria bacterium]|nr:hypothetical protein [Actinomycetota bacterium]
MSPTDPSPAEEGSSGQPGVSKGRTIGGSLVIFALALLAGLIVLTLVEQAIHYIWVEAAADITGPTMWIAVVGVTTVAGGLVALLRLKGQDGHNPMGGLAMVPVTLRHYPSILAAILVTLLGGLVLGPEVALVVTGSMVGTELGRRLGVVGKTATLVGIVGAILALVVRPLLSGSNIIVPQYTFSPIDVLGAIGVAAATAGTLYLARTLALAVISLRGGDVPRIIPMMAIGAVIGLIAAGYREFTDNPIAIILTSGEGMIEPLLGLGTAGAIMLATAFKWLVYALSLGGGFRGGPYFPALFVGAGIGGSASLAIPDLSAGAAAAGIAAAFAYLFHGSWKAIIILGALVGLFFGGWQAMLICIVAAAVAKILPAVKITTSREGDVSETLQR